MAAALAMGARGLGNVWPNPSVGCLLARDGRVVGRGVTAPGGRPHAETLALSHAGESAKGATAYITLEPCAHHGETPPCCDVLISAGVTRVVVALQDPDPRTAGAGIARLRDAGIEVVEDVLADEAREHHAGFLSRVIRARPLVTLKVAASLDGRIATHTGNSQWITGEAARRGGHILRANHDSIMIGSGTALSDDPSLTCRLPGLESRSPLRIVVDSSLRLPATSRLAATARDVPTWILCGEGCEADRRSRLEGLGVRLIEIRRSHDGRLDLASLVGVLGELGITRLLVEGGAALATGLLREQLVDRLAWFAASKLLGGDSLAAIGALGLDKVSQADTWRVMGYQPWQNDSVVMLEAQR